MGNVMDSIAGFIPGLVDKMTEKKPEEEPQVPLEDRLVEAKPGDMVLVTKKDLAETINHPQHYGGVEDPFEAIKVIEAWDLGFHLGNTIKYIKREGSKGTPLEDLKKARWYLDRKIQILERNK